MATTKALPHWDMTPIYPSLESPQFAQAFSSLLTALSELVALFDICAIRSEPHVTPSDEPTEISTTTPPPLPLLPTFETVLTRYNSVLDTARTVGAYISCFVTTDSRDTLAQAKMSELQQAQIRLSQLGIRFVAWIGSLDIETLIAQSPLAQEHAHMLRQAKVQATHLMSPDEEALAAELHVIGGSAWTKLHGTLTSQLLVTLETLEGTQTFPMSVARNLAFDPDRALRRRAYEAELIGWQQSAVPLAAALNSIKGEVNTITRRQRWDSPLDASLFSNSIDRQTLAVMMSVARASFPHFRRYLRAKAHMLGLERLAWYDLFSPLGNDEFVWEFDEAAQFIVEQFHTYSPRLANFAARAFREHWIDAEPRPGKRDGAYCISLRDDVSRVFANYKPTFPGVSTLAHELGHAYHNLNLSTRTALQKRLPMTLAETASTFCETIIRQAALRYASQREQMSILEASLQGSCQIVVDISSRFLFELRVFERRQQRELSIEELNEIMLEAQNETYGDALDPQALHPYMWAMKPHYYSADRSFYNYPYMFGLLFGLGLYARYRQDPESFKRGYDDLLTSTGLADAATLAARFGIDLHAESFWQASLDLIGTDIDLFEALSRS